MEQPNISRKGHSPTDSEVEAFVLDVTPAMAQDWLKHNNVAGGRINRPIDEPNVNKYDSFLRSGKWHLTTDAVGFDEDGYLINGQHRLQAVVKSGVTAPFLVVTGLEGDAFFAVDRGRKRTMALALEWAEVSYTKQVASALRSLVTWCRTEQFLPNVKEEFYPSPEGYVDYLTAHPNIEEWVKLVAPIAKRYKLSYGPLALLLYALHRIDEEMADLIMVSLEAGTSEKNRLVDRVVITWSARATQKPLARSHWTVEFGRLLVLWKAMQTGRTYHPDHTVRHVNGSRFPVPYSEDGLTIQQIFDFEKLCIDNGIQLPEPKLPPQKKKAGAPALRLRPHRAR